MNRLARQTKHAQRLISAQSSRPFSAYSARMADQDKSSLDANKGSVGAAFQPEGKVGQVGEKVGGPFSSQGKLPRIWETGGHSS